MARLTHAQSQQETRRCVILGNVKDTFTFLELRNLSLIIFMGIKYQIGWGFFVVFQCL